MFIIEDGTGSGAKAKVDASNRLLTKGSVETSAAEASISGLCWSFPTDFIALTTTGSFTGIAYLVNSGSYTIQVGELRVSNSAGVSQVKILKNPTAGTLISAGTAVTEVTTNFDSVKASGAAFKKGIDAQTVTDGTLLSQLQVGVGTDRIDISDCIILAPGDALAVVVKPSVASNVGCTLIVFSDLGD